MFQAGKQSVSRREHKDVESFKFAVKKMQLKALNLYAEYQ